MKNKLLDKSKDFSPFILFSVLITAFSVFYTRFFIKMDDGNFLGIVSAPDFTYKGWLTERYQTLSGRTIGELLMSFFIRQDLIVWQILNALIIIYISIFIYRVAKNFSGNFDDKDKQIFCCCGMFLMLVSCLNPSVFWFAGAFTYLWPFAGTLLTISPLLFYLLNGKFNNYSFIISIFSSFVATAQEQSAAICSALYLILLVLTIIKHTFKTRTLIPFAILILTDIHLFNSPGAHQRMELAISESFPRFAEFNFFDKLFCGFSVFSANTYYLSNFLLLLFVALLSVKIYSLTNKHKKLLISINCFSIFTCIVVNYLCAIIEKGLAHMIFRKCILENKYTFSFYMMTVLSVILTLVIAALILKLFLLDKKIGLIVAISSSAAICSLIVLGFSSSIFLSGQRIAFFTNMLIVISCAVLFSSLNKNKLTKFLYISAVVYATLTFTINCFAFKLFELPLMG